MEFEYHLGTYESFLRFYVESRLNQEDFYKKYHCFDVAHEIGHVICLSFGNPILNDLEALNQVEQELLVNDFSAAFWKKYGNQKFLNEILTYVKNEIESFIKNEGELYVSDDFKNIRKCTDYKEYYRKCAITIGLRNVLAFSQDEDKQAVLYNHFQNCSILESYHKDVTLDDVLQMMGAKDFLSFSTPENERKFEDNKDSAISTRNQIIAILQQHNINLGLIDIIPENVFCNYTRPKK